MGMMQATPNCRHSFTTNTAGAMDHTKPTETPLNIGLICRNNLSKSSAFIDMVGPIYADVLQMPRYLLNEVSQGVLEI